MQQSLRRKRGGPLQQLSRHSTRSKSCTLKSLKVPKTIVVLALIDLWMRK
jgi:hypothetical protein